MDWWSTHSELIATSLGYIVVGLSWIFMLKSDTRALGMKLEFLKTTVDRQSTEIGKLGELLSMMARYEERFVAVRNDIMSVKADMTEIKAEISDIRHLRGFVLPDEFKKGRSNQ